MKNLSQSILRICCVCFASLSLLIISTHVLASTTVSFTNNTVTSITDDSYNGTLGSMASSGVTVSGIPSGAVITNIRVIVSMNHTWVGDLVLKLESPDLTVLGLMSRSGFGESADDGTGGSGLADNLVSGYPVSFSDNGFYDAEYMGGTSDANNICQDDGQCDFYPNPDVVAAPPYLLSDFYNGTINGTWTFYAGDAGGGDVGTLVSWTLEITYDTPAANDNCADAVVIGCSLSTSVSGTTAGSTVDAIYSNCGAGGNSSTERGVWYVYPGDDSQVTITTCDASGTGYDSRLTVYSGSCGGLTCITGNDDMTPDCSFGSYRSSVTFNAYSGTDYYVFVHGYQFGTDLSETGDFVLNLTCGSLCSPVPANDECASAEIIIAGVTASGSTTCASSSPLFSNPACASLFSTPVDVWYSFTTGSGNAYNITLTELTSAYTGFVLYIGTCGSLAEVNGFCYPGGTFPVSLSPSTTYYIRIFNDSPADAGDFELDINPITPPANDDCSAVTPAMLTNGAGATTLIGTTVDATASSEEASLLGFAAVWEAVTLTGTCNNLTFDFCGTGAGIMAQSFVFYTDCPLTTTTAGLSNTTSCGDGNTTVNFYNLPAGTFYIPVLSDAIFNTLGTYSLNVTSEDCPAPPANNDCVNASALPCGSSVTGSTISATLDGPNTDCSGNSVAADVWYTYTGTGQDFTASLCGGGTDYDSKLDIYTGTCGALVSVDCNDDFCGLQSEVYVPSSNLGVTYYIRVHGFSGDVGNYELAILDNPPLITCPADVNVNTDAGICTASGVNLGTPIVNDDCGTAIVTNDAPSVFPVGTTTVTWTATDPGSQTATCTQTVTVTDNENPVITCPADISVSAEPGVCVSAVLNIGAASATDNCGVASVNNDATGNTFPVGITTVTWTATDVNGNTSTCTQTVTVTDNELPAITCPGDLTVGPDLGSCDATGVNLGNPVTDDNCGVATVINDAPSTFPPGPTTVTWTVIDVNSNSQTCTQVVTVTDNVPPTITCPSDVTVNTDAGICAATGVALSSPIVFDNCGTTNITNDAPSAYQLGNTTVTWTVTDANSNTATCTQTVTVTDIELPVITCAPTVNLDNSTGECGAFSTGLTAPPATDNCGIATITNDAPALLPIGTTTVTWTVTDVNGNSETCAQDVTVTDTELPTIACPTDLSVNPDLGSCDATGVVLGTPVTDDNCGVATVTNDAPSVFPAGPTTITWTVTDVNGNSKTCTQIVTVTDGIPPTITCPADVSISADAGECFATGVALGSPIAADNCGSVSTSNDAPSSFPVGNTTVTWTATDANGNTATCTQTVTVTDDELPVISCSPVTIGNSAGVCGALSTDLTNPTATDNCGVAAIINDAPSTLPIGTTTVTWTVTDVNGNSETCSQDVTVEDTEDPTVTCPVDVTVSTDNGSCDATGVVLGTPTTSDNCAVDVIGNDAPVSFPLGNTTVTWTVTDIYGNSATCTQTVTVTDDELPAINCPSDVTVTADAGSCAATGVALGSPGTSDNCGVDNVTNDAPSSFPVGNTTVTWTVTDVNGNSNTCTQTVTVTDDELPVLTCGSSITIDNSPGECGALNTSLTPPSATDNCGIGTVANDAPSTLPIGTTTVTWTVTDVNGNSETCSQDITVEDTEAPTITCPADVSASTDAGTCTATGVNLGTPTTGDNCGVTSVTNDAPSSYAIGNTTVTWTVTDDYGNTSTCTQTVTVTDDEQPTITCPADVSASADAGACVATGVTLGTPTTGDNCGVAAVTNDAPASFPVGTTTVTWTVTDDNGNSNTCTQTVTVSDDELPAIACVPTVSIDNDNGVCGAAGTSLVAPSATDNCGIATVTSDAPSTLPLGTTTVTWTVTDVNGNTNTCVQSVTVNDTEAPTISCPADVSTDAVTGTCFATGVALGTPVTGDNCGAASVTNDAPVNFSVGNTTVTWTVTDVNGNTSTCTQTVTVNDMEAPSITCPADVSVDADAGSCDATGVTLGSAISVDNCGPVTITNDAPATFPLGATTVTWTSTDASGNIATCTQTVTVNDTEAPTISCPGNIGTYLDWQSCVATGVLLGTPVTADNCSVASVTNDAPLSFPLDTTVVTWTVTDPSGNTGTCTHLVITLDTQLPAITCPADVNANTDAGSCTASNVTLGTPVTTDNCTVAATTNNAPASYPVGPTTVIWTVTDSKGNTANCPQTVTVTDIELPTIVCPPPVNATANASPCVANNVSLGTPTTSDNCSVASTTNNAPSIFPVGTTAVVWTVTDNNGNTATCTQTVTVTSPKDTSVTFNGTSFTATATGATFQWYNCTTGTNITGQTGATFTPSATGSYAIIVTKNGCSDTSRCFNFIYISIDEISSFTDLKVFPNPFSSQLHIHVESSSAERIDVRMFDVTGKLVAVYPNMEPDTDLRVGAELTSGAYFVEVQQGQFRKVVRVVKTE